MHVCPYPSPRSRESHPLAATCRRRTSLLDSAQVFVAGEFAQEFARGTSTSVIVLDGTLRRFRAGLRLVAVNPPIERVILCVEILFFHKASVFTTNPSRSCPSGTLPAGDSRP